MKILLINPPYDIENYYGKLSEMGFRFPPVGLTYLAAYMRKLGHEMAIYDFQVEKRDFEHFIDRYKPDLVGVTCQTALFYNTLKLAENIKKMFPDAPILVGGAHASYRPNDFFESKAIDIVVRGEGEITLSELANHYEKSAIQLKDIRGISFRENGEIRHNLNRDLIKDLNILPMPAVDLIPFERYRVSPDNYLGGRVGLITTTRGCPYNCMFCACKEAFNRTYRIRDLKNVFDEIEYYINNYQISELFIMDDCFGLDKERSIRFCREMIKRGYNKKLSWWCQLRVDCVSEELLWYMRQAGCGIISFGLESGVQRLLDKISKRVTLDQIRWAVKKSKKAGLMPRGSFILGLPTETLKDSLKTILFSLSLPLCRAKFGLATPYPGTELWDIALAEGQVKSEGEDWDRFSQMTAYTKYDPPYIPKGRKAAELLFLQKFANFIFYLKPTVVLSLLKQIRSFKELKYFIRSLFRFVWGTVKR
jgi:anaerobic magnesium-protoporphyrin IX monomethyl ester cyclase